jgi:predicted RNA-binding Zn ribbon-like protein
VEAGLGRIVALVAAAMADGTWPRLKVCLADDCQWAFYDLSRNRSAVWCDMRVCGNRHKVRAFRERHEAKSPPG